MKGLLTKALPALTILTMTPFVSSAVQAMGFKNCTGVPIRVHMYNNDDSIQAVARAGGKIEPNELRKWNVGKGRILIKTFQTGFIDQMKFSQGNLNGNWDYLITLDNKGNWNVEEAGHPVRACP